MANTERASVVIALVGILLMAGAAHGVSPADKCEASKLNVAGKYSFCRIKAEAKAVKTGSAPDFSKCDATFAAKWASAETKGGGMCPTTGDLTAIKATIATDTDAIEAALDGGGPPPACTGQLVGGFCWFLGGNGQSCDTVCTALGKTCDPATVSYVGSAGSDSNCQSVLNALGSPGALTFPSFDCTGTAGAVGCSETGNLTARCAMPTTTCSAGTGGYVRACACH